MNCKDCINNNSCPIQFTAYELIEKKIECAYIKPKLNFVEVPCKVGDTVYVNFMGEVTDANILKYEINSIGITATVYIDPDYEIEYDIEDIFLTKEEAEKALAERNKE